MKFLRKIKKVKKYLTVEVIVCLLFVIAAIYIYVNTNKSDLAPTKPLTIQSILLNPDHNKKLLKKKKKENKYEEICRSIFQDIFKVPFKSVRPLWLKNPQTGRNLELDGFNDAIVTPIGIGLAFEYDGKQHDEYVPRFHRKGKIEYIYQKKKDYWKDLMCKKKGVKLIRIPHTVKKEMLREYIEKQLMMIGMNI